MEASSNIVSLALEHRTVDQTLTYYYNAITASSIQYAVDLTQPLQPHQLTILLRKYPYHTHPIIAMSFFLGDLCLEDQTEIYQLPLHPIVLNFRSWCRCIQDSDEFAPSEPIMEVSKPTDLPEYTYPQGQIFESQFWLQTQGWIEARTCYQFLVDRNITQYNPMGIIILYNRVYECVSTMYTDYTNNFDTSHVAYPENLTMEEQAEWTIFAALQPPFSDVSTTPTTRQTSTTDALHTYPLKYVPSYIFPSTTSSHPSAPTPSSSPILPTETIPSQEPAIPKQVHGDAETHNFVQQMLQPLVNNIDAAPTATILFPDIQTKIPQVAEY